jgi:pimeloyl-ACP methyl ester carboxylesterase
VAAGADTALVVVATAAAGDPAAIATGSNSTITRAGGLPHVLLLSGLLSDETVWDDVAQRLAGVAHVQIVCFPSMPSIVAMADAVERVAPPRCALAGHSMGGRVALEVWRRQPQRVSALCLACSGVHPATEQEPAHRGRLVQLARDRGMAALAAQWLPPLMGTTPPSRPGVLPRLETMVERQTAESFAAQTSAMLNRPDARPVLPSIQVPALVLCGRHDAGSPVAQQEAMCRAIGGATLTIIEDAGHMAPIEQPDPVAGALRQWLAAAD